MPAAHAPWTLGRSLHALKTCCYIVSQISFLKVGVVDGRRWRRNLLQNECRSLAIRGSRSRATGRRAFCPRNTLIAWCERCWSVFFRCSFICSLSCSGKRRNLFSWAESRMSAISSIVFSSPLSQWTAVAKVQSGIADRDCYVVCDWNFWRSMLRRMTAHSCCCGCVVNSAATCCFVCSA